MTPEELKKAVLSVKRWSRSDQRAPNKPLMMIYALSEYIKGHGQLFSFEHEVENQVNELLSRFGPSRKSYHSLYGFWRLINDGFWRLDNAADCLPRKSNTDPPKSELLKYKVMGGFSDEAYQLLKSNNDLTIELIELLLSENFPESMISDIASHLSLELNVIHTRKRDPSFRRDVLRAYNYQCAVCGYDLRMDDVSFGLEAAHIKWKQFHGPCNINNGLALCAIHHKAFDKGVMGFDSNLRVILSKLLNGSEIVQSLFYKFEGKRIYEVRNPIWKPNDSYLGWHKAEVFKK
jgi:putative restriction endonuclease